MFLTLSFNECPFMGKTFFFEGFTDGKIRMPTCQYIKENKCRRIFFDGKNEKECISQARTFCNILDVGSTRSKLKLMLDQIEEKINPPICMKEDINELEMQYRCDKGSKELNYAQLELFE